MELASHLVTWFEVNCLTSCNFLPNNPEIRRGLHTLLTVLARNRPLIEGLSEFLSTIVYRLPYRSYFIRTLDEINERYRVLPSIPRLNLLLVAHTPNQAVTLKISCGEIDEVGGYPLVECCWQETRLVDIRVLVSTPVPCRIIQVLASVLWDRHHALAEVKRTFPEAVGSYHLLLQHYVLRLSSP
jgi:hypothetical protein